MSLAPDEEYCRSCGNPVKKSAVVCPDCGVNTDKNSSTTAETVYCESCGESIKAQAEICPNCGVKNNQSSSGGLDIDSEALYYVQLGFGALFLLAAIGSVVDLTDGILVSVISALLYGIVGLVLIPPVRDNLEKRHPISTFGTVQAVNTTSVSNSKKNCSVCFEPIESGQQRTYGDEFVAFGITLYSNYDGENYYCSSCLREESSLQVGASSSVDTEK